VKHSAWPRHYMREHDTTNGGKPLARCDPNARDDKVCLLEGGLVNLIRWNTPKPTVFSFIQDPRGTVLELWRTRSK
jgi:hypothetical protein